MDATMEDVILIYPFATPWILVGIVLAWCLSDLVFYITSGNDSTYSMSMLRRAANSLTVTRGTPYTFGVLCGHLFIPSLDVPSTFTYTLLRLGAVAAPIVWTLIRILLTKPATDSQLDAKAKQQSKWLTGLSLVLHFAVGVFFGAVGVPQHLR